MNISLDCKAIVADEKASFTISLSYEMVREIVNCMEDIESNSDAFELFSCHPCAEVRACVADKEIISAITVSNLSADKSIDVLRKLTRNSAFREHANEEMVFMLAEKDPSLAENIGSYAEAFSQVDVSKIAKALAEYSDPLVRRAVAGNSSTPKKILKMLLEDTDASVSSAAKYTLR